MSTKKQAPSSNPAEHTIYWIKDLFKKYKVSDHVQCFDGCYYCCHQIVSLTIFEAIRVVEGFERLTAAQRLKAHSQAVINVKANDDASSDRQRWEKRLPCSLLTDKRCSIYDNRPISCIATTSMDRDYCIELYENLNSSQHRPPTVQIDGLTPQSILNYQVALGVDRKINTEILQLALRIDLDRLVMNFCVSNVDVRKSNLEKLLAYDMQMLERLEKRTD